MTEEQAKAIDEIELSEENGVDVAYCLKYDALCCGVCCLSKVCKKPDSTEELKYYLSRFNKESGE